MDVRLQKEIGLAVVAVLLSVVLFFSYVVLLPQVVQAPAIIVALVVLAVLWLAMMAVTLALVQSVYSVVGVLAAAAVLVVLAGSFHIGAVAAGIVLMLTGWWARHTFREDITDRIRYRTRRIFGGGVQVLAMGLMIVLAGLAAPVVEASFEERGLQVSESVVEASLQPVLPILRQGFGGQAGAPDRGLPTLDQLIDAQLQQLAPGTTLAPQERLLIQQQLRQQFGASGTSESPSIAAVVTQTLNTWLERVTAGSPTVVALAVVGLALLTLYPALRVTGWLALGLVAGMVWVGRKTGLFVLTQEQVMAETLTL